MYLHSFLPEEFNLDYFIYACTSFCSYGEVLNTPVSVLVKMLCFRKHDEFVSREIINTEK